MIKKLLPAISAGLIFYCGITLANNNTTTQQLQQEINQLQTQLEQLRYNDTNHDKNNKSVAKISNFSNLVTIGAPLGMPNHYNGSILLIYTPSINKDYHLLQRNLAEQKYQTSNDNSVIIPSITLSGEIEAEALYKNPSNNKYTTDINLNAVKLDILVKVASWINGFTEFAYDDNSSDNSANRQNNSNIYLDKAFILLGDLSKSPIYSSIGQEYVPFGKYSYASYDEPLTEDIGKTKERTVIVGYNADKNNIPYVSAYIFSGTTNHITTNRVNNGGINLGIKLQRNKIKTQIDAGYINNIADAKGFLNTGANTGFTGFANNNDNHLAHNVAGYDINNHITYKNVTLINEYITAASQFNIQDLSFNNKKARPSANTIELDTAFHVINHPLTASVSYSRSRQSVALNLPKHRYIISLTDYFIHNTLVSIEYRYDKNYSHNDNGSGAGNLVIQGDNEHQNVLLANVGVYF